jgi:hypothetical protein
MPNFFHILQFIDVSTTLVRPRRSGWYLFHARESCAAVAVMPASLALRTTALNVPFHVHVWHRRRYSGHPPGVALEY